ncbi:RNA polymerase sigma factor [Sphingomonas corticis]
MTDPSDADLAARAIGGDQTAYAALMTRHRDAVYRMARGATGDADAALDVTQEAFVAAFAALSRYDPARPFRHWLARIALNKARDHARRRAVRRFFARARPLDEALDAADPAPTPEEAADDRRRLARARAAIAALPAALREVLLLRGVEQMSQAETAAVLGIGEKAVETRLYRARRRLAETMRESAPPRV